MGTAMVGRRGSDRNNVGVPRRGWKGGSEVRLFHTLSSRELCEVPPRVCGQVSPVDWKSTVKYPEK